QRAEIRRSGTRLCIRYFGQRELLRGGEWGARLIMLRPELTRFFPSTLRKLHTFYHHRTHHLQRRTLSRDVRLHFRNDCKISNDFILESTRRDWTQHDALNSSTDGR